MAAKKQIELTLDEAFNEINQLVNPGLRLPGDIDSVQLAERWKISRRTASDRMRKLVQSGQYARLNVYDQTLKRNISIYRRAP